MRKTIVISGINIVDGGAKSVYDDLLNTIVNDKLYKKYSLIVLVSQKKLFKQFAAYFKIIEFPKSKKHWINRLYYEYFYFKRLSKQLHPYIWLSMHDVTPNVIADKRYVYCHNPSPFYNMKLQEAKYGWKYYIFSKFYKYLYRINIHKNDGVIVQQQWMATAFKRMYDLNNVIIAQPSINGPKIKKIDSRNKLVTFIYPSFPRPFKNFEVVCEAVKVLNKKNLKSKFIVLITLDGTENSYSRMLFNKYGDVSNIKFIGLQSRQELFDYYAKCNCLIFMSKLETWGMPISEFKVTEKPIITVDLPYAHETVGDYSNVSYVSPHKTVDLADEMAQVINVNAKPFNHVFNKSNDKFIHVNNWEELIQTLTR